MEVGTTSKATEKNVTLFEGISDQKTIHKTPTKEESELLWKILARGSLMKNKRSNLDKKWAMYQKQYESLYTPYADGRSSSNVALERAVVEQYVWEALKRPTEFIFTGWVGYEFQEQVLEKVWKDDWSKNKRGSAILENEYRTAIYGTSIIYLGYERTSRIITDFDKVGIDGKIKYKRKLLTESKVLLENVDIRNFWIDERATSIDNAIDCMMEVYMPYEDFLNLKLDKNYKTYKLDQVSATMSKDSGYGRPFQNEEEASDGSNQYVKITKYWNVKDDKYYEIAND